MTRKPRPGELTKREAVLMAIVATAMATVIIMGILDQVVNG